jgi:hypothetical protein
MRGRLIVRRRDMLIWGLVAVAVIVALVFILKPGANNGTPKGETITFKVDGPDPDRKPDDIVKAGGGAAQVLDQAQSKPLDFGGNLRGKDPTKEGTVSGPLASPEWPGCKTRFTPVNFSSRTAPIRGFALHFTASPNRPGWADMNGLAAFSSSRSAGVSWHFLVDREGHCYYMVPVSKKAWTIGNLNSQTINVETIGTGREPGYGGTAGFRKVAAIVRRAASIYHFPVRLGAVSGCNITRPGVITHWMGGACAGGHVDVRPYDIAGIVRQMAATGAKPLTASQRHACSALQFHRARAHKLGKWSPQRAKRAAELKRMIPTGQCRSRFV